MNDADIIKALECCAKPYCNDKKCPLHKNTINTKDCITQLSTNALDLINRQKAEIEQQKSDIATLKDSNVNLQELYYAEKEKVAKAKQKVIDVCKTLKTARAEAITEFAERLCEGRVSNDPVVIAVKVELEMMKEGVKNA